MDAEDNRWLNWQICRSASIVSCTRLHCDIRLQRQRGHFSPVCHGSRYSHGCLPPRYNDIATSSGWYVTDISFCLTQGIWMFCFLSWWDCVVSLLFMMDLGITNYIPTYISLPTGYRTWVTCSIRVDECGLPTQTETVDDRFIKKYGQI